MTMPRRLGAALCVAFGLLFVASRAFAAFEIMIPAYFYPAGNPGASDWGAIASAASAGYKVTAILNPNSGPGDSQDPNYLSAAYGVRCGVCSEVLGFTFTRYGERPIDDVKKAIDGYYSFYPVSGIFLDEMVSAYMLDPANVGKTYTDPMGATVTIKSANFYLNYYSELYKYIQGKHADTPFVKPNGTPVATGTRVVGNVGINAAEITLTGGSGYGKLADDVIVLEQSYNFLVGNVPAGADKYAVSDWNLTNPAYHDDLGYLIHSTSPSQLNNALQTIDHLGGGIAYVTDAPVGPDTFSQLTPYWNTLLANCTICPSPIPEPPTTLLVLALFILGVSRAAPRGVLRSGRTGSTSLSRPVSV